MAIQKLYQLGVAAAATLILLMLSLLGQKLFGRSLREDLGKETRHGGCSKWAMFSGFSSL
ncbi:MAG: hypothetical protein RMJ98_08630 [Myxococcales bacterium]|nr:hypothetical protein [Polyangiaceae bacterium]MDW8249353.1 hypothetical protein [Myxococcales bacterium]